MDDLTRTVSFQFSDEDRTLLREHCKAARIHMTDYIAAIVRGDLKGAKKASYGIKQIEDIWLTNDGLRLYVEELEKEAVAREKEIQELGVSNQSLEVGCDAHRDECIRLEKQITEIHKGATLKEKQLERDVASRDGTIKTGMKQLSDLAAFIKTKEEETKVIEDKKDTLQVKLDTANDEVGEITDERDHLQIELDDIKDECEEITEERDDLQIELDEIKDKRNHLNNESLKYQDEAEVIREELDMVNADHRTLNTNYRQMQKDYENVLKTLKEYKNSFWKRLFG